MTFTADNIQHFAVVLQFTQVERFIEVKLFEYINEWSKHLMYEFGGIYCVQTDFSRQTKENLCCFRKHSNKTL